MHTQTLDTQTAPQPEIQQSRPAQSKLTKTAIRLVLSSAVLLATCGFDDQKEQQLLDMLAYKDVHDKV